jgi:hypothetical protein
MRVDFNDAKHVVCDEHPFAHWPDRHHTLGSLVMSRMPHTFICFYRWKISIDHVGVCNDGYLGRILGIAEKGIATTTSAPLLGDYLRGNRRFLTTACAM